MTISHYDGALKPTRYLSHKNRFYKRFFYAYELSNPCHDR